MSMQFDPIGIFRCRERYPYDVARQGTVADGNLGMIELFSGRSFEQALFELESFSHLWLIFAFHLNAHWKPMVSPPRHRKAKVGVFASRAPYRPNPIGITCVRLLACKGLQVYVRGHDLLDETPVLDIKPYLRYADCHPEASDGWLGADEAYLVQFEPLAELQLKWLEKQGLDCLRQFLVNQLQYEPTNAQRHRLSKSGENASCLLAYRTWRAEFCADDNDRIVKVKKIDSGYSSGELQDDNDPYQDKSLHRNFKGALFSLEN